MLLVIQSSDHSLPLALELLLALPLGLLILNCLWLFLFPFIINRLLLCLLIKKALVLNAVVSFNRTIFVNAAFFGF
jgi:hypothetical protein